MIFTRIIYSAILIGLMAGLLLSLMQIATVDPIIFEAETFETSEPSAASEDGHHEATWGPEDGAERRFYTVIANILASTGFAAVLLALMSQFWLPKQRVINPLQGVVWGLAGFVVIYLAPGIGLPPEIPGMEAAPIEHRQVWWVLTVTCAGIGLGILALAQNRLKAIGLVFLAIPYLVGTPSHQGPEFSHPDPAAVAALIELHQRFIVTSGFTNLLFWIALGMICSVVFNRWFRPTVMSDENVA